MSSSFRVLLLGALLFSACTKAAEPTSTVPPQYVEAARRAKASFERGDYREAERIYESLLKQLPKNLYVLSNLGVTRFRVGKLKLAEDAFRRAIEVAPADGFSHCTLGIVYYTEARYDDAVNSLTKALAINPNDATAHRYLSIVAAKKGWHEAAIKELETAEKLDPSPKAEPSFGDFLTPLEKSRLQLPNSTK